MRVEVWVFSPEPAVGVFTPARDAGIHAVHYRNNTQAIEEIEKLITTP